MSLFAKVKSSALIIPFILAIGSVACNRSAAREENGAVASGAELPPVAVTTTTAVAREVSSFIQATGSLVAEETSDVAPQISGQVVATLVNVGAFVRQGAVIARLDDRDARLRVEQARANLRQTEAAVRQAEARLGLRGGGGFNAETIPEVRAARANYEQALAELQLAEANEKRYRELVETGDVARNIYDQYRTQRDTARARANSAREQLEAAINAARQNNEAIRTAEAAVEGARAQLAIAQKALSDTVIRAPYSGYISNRPVAVGEYVTPASVIVTLLRTNPIKLQAQVPEAEAPFIRPGMSVSVEVEAFPQRRFAGRVVAVNPAIDPASRSAIVEAEIENGDNALRSGMFAKVRILRGQGQRVVLVPRAAVLRDQSTQSYRVFVVQGGVARLRVVQLGEEEGDMVQIISGVNDGEVVATSNLPQLYEGAKIRPVS
ncbi:MAG: hypothetical protein C4334_05305 [Pyrinomonas sp.]|uniref:efflux RND transporter periplasmic adaptor subunit n=1 Tax=Pyrinomonas sp. TaxID=2080306 RepID=UPI003330528B